MRWPRGVVNRAEVELNPAMGIESELGGGPEFDLIARVRERLGRARSENAVPLPEQVAERAITVGIGDDAAVTVPGGATATSVDALVEGVHFDRSSAPLSAIGHKALATALSDLAAMGAVPGEAYVVLGVPERLEPDEVLEICNGIAELAAATGTRILGGDLTRSVVLFLSVTVVGHASSAAELVSRAGATPGGLLAVTGELGGAAAGHILLERPELSAAIAVEEANRLCERQLRPQPRLAAGIALAGAGAEAMIDLSDGLGYDATHLSAASKVGLRVELGHVPAQPGVLGLAEAAEIDPLGLLAAGGEDYELLVVVPAHRFRDAESAVRRTGTALTAIGEVMMGSEVELHEPGGGVRPASGFDHFRHKSEDAG